MGAKLIALTQNKCAIVDESDYEILSQHKWCVQKHSRTYYATRSSKGKMITMHRLLLDPPEGMCCDHKNHDGLDNRRCNLRLCTNAQNMYNQRLRIGCSSVYKGVSWNRNNGKWRADIQFEGRLRHIGYYDYQIDAAIAYDDKALELFGEFAYLNCQARPEVKQWIEDNYLFTPQTVTAQALPCELSPA